MSRPEVDELSMLVAQLEERVDQVIAQRDAAIANQGVPADEFAALAGKVRSLNDRVNQALR